MSLDDFGLKEQKRLSSAKVLIVGAGGLGCPVALYLTSIGVGKIGICDFDIVSLKNLPRQILFDEKDIGKSKVEASIQKLRQKNSKVDFIGVNAKLTEENALGVITYYDIVVDCTDNFKTRYILDDSCKLLKKPLVHGSIYKYEGQVGVFNVKRDDGSYSPGYRDIFPEDKLISVPNCEESGVIPTITGIIGIVEANETIKYITGIGDLLTSKLFIFDVKNMTSYTIDLTLMKENKLKVSKKKKIHLISPEELKRSIDKGTFNLIDVRTPKEHEEFNIGGKNIPLENFSENVGLFKFDKPIVFYCRSGKRSSVAVEFIQEKYPHAKALSLDGGILNWN